MIVLTAVYQSVIEVIMFEHLFAMLLQFLREYPQAVIRNFSIFGREDAAEGVETRENQPFVKDGIGTGHSRENIAARSESVGIGRGRPLAASVDELLCMRQPRMSFFNEGGEPFAIIIKIACGIVFHIVRDLSGLKVQVAACTLRVCCYMLCPLRFLFAAMSGTCSTDC